MCGIDSLMWLDVGLLLLLSEFVVRCDLVSLAPLCVLDCSLCWFLSVAGLILSSLCNTVPEVSLLKYRGGTPMHDEDRVGGGALHEVHRTTPITKAFKPMLLTRTTDSSALRH